MYSSLTRLGSLINDEYIQQVTPDYLFLFTAAIMNPINGDVNKEMKMMRPLLSPCSSAYFPTRIERTTHMMIKTISIMPPI